MMQTTLSNALRHMTIKDLKKLANSDKDYFIFEIDGFNSGFVINVKKTNVFRNPCYEKFFNGHDFIIENDYTTQHYVEQTIKDKEI